MAAAGESADVVKRWEHITDSNSLEDTALVPVAVVFKHSSALQVSMIGKTVYGQSLI